MPERYSKTEEFSPERYELNQPLRYRFELSRRGFLGLAGAGLLVSVRPETAFSQTPEAAPGDRVSARIHVGKDGRVTVMSSKVEFGQGARAQLTQAAAEELRVPVERIDLILGDTALTPDDGGTFGSRTTPVTVPSVRRGAAAAREILIELASRKWNADRELLQAEDGAVVDAGGRRITYGELAAWADLEEAFDRVASADAPLTPFEEWRILGTSVRRPNGRAIVTGAHRFPADVRLSGMLYGKVLRPPSYGAVLERIDLSAASSLPGVVAVRDGNFVGCAAPTSFQAQQALDALSETASWSQPEHPSSRNLFSYLKENVVSGQPGWRGPRVSEHGSVDEGLAAAEKVLQASYEIAYIQHAPMEPRAAAAQWEDGRLTVWTGTQRPNGVRRELAGAFRIPDRRVRVIVPDTGGGFGGKHTGDAAVEAARLAQEAKRPVSVVWTREEEFAWAYFRPAGLIDTRAGIGGDGKLLSWEFINYNSGAAALGVSYQIPHRREEYRPCDSPLRQGSYRVLAATANNFARESFMDELAAAAGRDPLEFRLVHLQEERLRNVLEAAAERFGWPGKETGEGVDRGVGLACGTEKGSFVAACVEAAVDREEGAIQVLRICQAFECGAILNPDNLRAQVEGCAIMTLGGALSEEIHFEEGRLLNGRFSQYPVPRFRDVPPMETVLLNRPDLPSAGAGETPMIAIPPAVANAVFNACGVRLRSLPLHGEKLRNA